MRRKLILCGSLALALAACQTHRAPKPDADAQAAPKPVSKPAKPPRPVAWNGPIPPDKAQWGSTPNGAVMSRLFPLLAQKSHVNGEAVVRCHVLPTGKFENCDIVSEKPAGYGFGPASIRAMEYMSLVPGRYGRKATIDIPVHWGAR